MSNLDAEYLSSKVCRYGKVTIISEDNPIGVSLSYYGEWAQSEIDFMSTLVPEGGTFVDVGANIGTHSLAMAHIVGPEGTVIALEPQSLLFDLLAHNVKEHKNVKCINSAAGAESGTAYIDVLDPTINNNFGALAINLLKSSPSQSQVNVITIDSLDLERCDLIKADTEGSESQVIQGSRSTIERLRPILLTEVNTLENLVKTLEAFTVEDYKPLIVQTEVWNPDNFQQNSKNLFGYAYESALLFVPLEKLKFLPSPNQRVRWYEFDSIDVAGNLLLGTPRFGDFSIHDRDPVFLRGAVTDLERRISESKFREESLEIALISKIELLSQTEATHSREKEAARLEIEAARLEIEAARLEIDKNEIELIRANNVLTEVLNSTSWRATRALRATRKLIESMMSAFR
jgi:FkbM family methyltransferase